MSRLGGIGVSGYGLLALCLALAGMIFFELQGDPAVAPQSTTPAPVAAAPAVPAHAVIRVPPLASFAAVVERPLFSSTRRLVPVQVKAARTDPALDLRHLVLTGVLIVGPDNQLAIVLDRSRREHVRVRKGGTIAGWVLAEVRVDGVTLRRGAATHEMTLHEDKAQKGAGSPLAGKTSQQGARKQ